MTDAKPHSSSHARVTRRKGFLQRSRPLVAVLAVLFFLAWVDGRFKASPIVGYCPSNATWAVISDDFGRFWKGVETSEAFVRIVQEGFNPLHDTVLSIRKRTGIRPTPQRWATWFGPRFVAAQSEAGVGFCVRPGILLRALGYFNRVRSGGPSDNGVYAWDDLFYGWRDGFLIISPSPGYVAAVLDDSAQDFGDSSRPPNGLHFRWFGEREWGVSVSGGNGLPVVARVQATFEHRAMPLTLTGIWPEPPLLSVSGSNPHELATVVRGLVERIPHLDFLERILDEMEKTLSNEWIEGGDEYAFALVGLDTAEVLPVPEIALVLRGPKLPFLPEGPPSSIPFEWAASPGWVMPWMGEKMSFSMGQHERDRYLTSQEPIMARHLGHLKQGRKSSADLIVVLDWAKFAEAATALLTKAAENELLPRMNRGDLESKVLPYVEMLAHLGTMRLEGRSDGDSLHFEGVLASPEGTTGLSPEGTTGLSPEGTTGLSPEGTTGPSPTRAKGLL